MKVRRATTGAIFDLDASNLLGSGGEAAVYTVPGYQKLVAKIHHQRSASRAAKLAVMIANPPDDPSANLGHTSIAWPRELLVSPKDGTTVGFLMPKIDGMKSIVEFYNPKSRRKQAPLFHFGYLLRAGRNLAAVFWALHTKNYAIGDVNESNVLVADTALVSTVDTDSFQIVDPKSGKIFRCEVGRPEFTPPELQQSGFSSVERTATHDAFGLAVLLFQLLMEGTHPFDGVFQGNGDAPEIADRIKAGHFPYAKTRRVPYLPKPTAPGFGTLPPAIQQLFLDAFDHGHSAPSLRPDARAWRDALDLAEANLKPCKVNSQHLYASHFAKCPWCERKTLLGGRDPFPSQADVRAGAHQKPLRPSAGGQAYASQANARQAGYTATAAPYPQSPPAQVSKPPFPVAKAFMWGAGILVSVWLIGLIFNGSPPKLSTISLTGVQITEGVANGGPLNGTASFVWPSIPTLFVRYAGATVGSDSILTSVWRNGLEITRCTPQVLTSQSGTYWCTVVKPRLEVGDYTFQLAVNSKVVGNYPFSIVSPQPDNAPPVAERQCPGPVDSPLVAICKSPELSDLNNQVLQLQSALDKQTGTSGSLRQTAWQTESVANCRLAPSFPDCLKSVLTARYQDLQTAIAAAAPRAEAGPPQAELQPAYPLDDSAQAVPPRNDRVGNGNQVRCILPTGSERLLSRFNCRQRAGLIDE